MNIQNSKYGKTVEKESLTDNEEDVRVESAPTDDGFVYGTDVSTVPPSDSEDDDAKPSIDQFTRGYGGVYTDTDTVVRTYGEDTLVKMTKDVIHLKEVANGLSNDLKVDYEILKGWAKDDLEDLVTEISRDVDQKAKNAHDKMEKMYLEVKKMAEKIEDLEETKFIVRFDFYAQCEGKTIECVECIEFKRHSSGFLTWKKWFNGTNTWADLTIKETQMHFQGLGYTHVRVGMPMAFK